MDQFFPLLGHWVWWVAAGIMLMLELVAPGVFFIWLAIAAALTGVAGRRIYRGRNTEPDDNPYLNRRQHGYVGRSFTLKQPILNGRGKLVIDDTIWEIEGPDMVPGARVTVTAVDGMRLLVAPA